MDGKREEGDFVEGREGETIIHIRKSSELRAAVSRLYGVGLRCYFNLFVILDRTSSCYVGGN